MHECFTPIPEPAPTVERLMLSSDHVGAMSILAAWSSHDHTEGRILARIVEALREGKTVIIKESQNAPIY